MPEQFRFEQRLRNRAAIHRHERLVAPRAGPMDRTGEQFLAGAGVAVDENARIRIGDEPRLAQQILHPRAARDDARAPLARHVRALERRIAGDAKRRGDLLQELLTVERLGQKSEHAALRRGDGVRNGSVRREDDHRQRRMLAVNRLEQLQAVDAGHSQIGDDDPRSRDRQRGERRLAAVGGSHAMARGRKPEADELEQVGIVVDQQYVAGACRHDRPVSGVNRLRRHRHRRRWIRRHRPRRRCECDREAGRVPCCAAPRAS